MNSKLDYYLIFNEIVQCKSFSLAAKKMFMSQPAVSQAIAQLERDLGVRLFTRTPRGVVLTNEGELLYEFVGTAIGLISRGEQKLKDTKDLSRGQLSIGVGDTISRYFLISYLESFNNKYPYVKLRIINKTTMELITLLKAGAIEIAICNLPIIDKALSIEPCAEIQDTFVVGERYRHLTESIISLKEILEYPIIMLDEKSRTRQYVEEQISKHGYKLNPEIELGSHDLLLEFARIGLGVACVVKEYAKTYLDESLVYELNLESKLKSRSIGICTLKGVSMTPAAKEFSSMIGGVEP